MLSNALLNQYLGLLPARYWKCAKTPYESVVNFLPATLSVNTIGQFNVDSDSDLMVYGQVALVTETDDTTPVPLPPLTVDIRDAGSGRNWSSAPVPLVNWFGTAQMPYLYQKPRVLGGASVLTVTVANLSTTSRNVRLTFLGVKLFPYAES